MTSLPDLPDGKIGELIFNFTALEPHQESTEVTNPLEPQGVAAVEAKEADKSSINYSQLRFGGSDIDSPACVDHGQPPAASMECTKNCDLSVMTHGLSEEILAEDPCDNDGMTSCSQTTVSGDMEPPLAPGEDMLPPHMLKRPDGQSTVCAEPLGIGNVCCESSSSSSPLTLLSDLCDTCSAGTTERQQLPQGVTKQLSEFGLESTVQWLQTGE